MTQTILQAINLSFVANSETLKVATNTLLQFQKQPGYCIKLMEIADSAQVSIPIKQSVLIQLKNTIKKFWDATHFQISQEEKKQIMHNLLIAFIRCSYDFQLVKLYREIVTGVIKFEYKRWLPLENIINKLNNNEDIVATLHFILAISTNFQFGAIDDERKYYYEFLKVIFPCLFSLFQRNQDSQTIYLIIKVIWKAVHYQISDEVRRLICNWMEMIITVAGAQNHDFQSKIQDNQERGTPQFFYFHAKKWATRILYRFIFRHAKPGIAPFASEEVQSINKQFSQLWYQNYGQKVIEIIVKQFSIPCTKKIRFFQLKCLSGLIEEQPNVMKNYAQYFQYEVLLPYLKLTHEDEELAQNDPMEFINQEMDSTIGYTNLKRAATEVWTNFTEIGMKGKTKKKVGPLFYDNMNFLKSKLQGTNILEKEMAMYLICELRFSIFGCEEVKDIIPELVEKYIVSEFSSEIMFLKARSVQIFSEYGSLPYNQNLIKKAAEGIYLCLINDNKPIVRIKAAQAFHCLLKHKVAKQLAKDFLQQILEVYVALVEKYDLEILVHSLESIVENFSLEISPYAFELVNYLAKHFVKLYHKDNEQSKEASYDGETQLAAAGALSAIKTIVESPVDREKIMQMETDVLGVCDLVFASDDTDYIQDALCMLKAYTHKITSVSERLLFYFPICIYYLKGIKQQYQPFISTLNISDHHKKILINLKSSCSIEVLDSVMPVLRNFIHHGSELLFNSNDLFNTNLLQLLFEMIDSIYQKGPSQYDGEVQMNGCTVLLIYLITNNYQKLNNNLISHIWKVTKHNFLHSKSKSLTTLNVQLSCVLLWNSVSSVVSEAQHDNLLQIMIKNSITSEPLLRQEHQRQRVILGLCTLLGMKEKPNEIFKLLPQIFTTLISLVKKNAEVRLDSQNQENYITDSEDEEDESNLVNFGFAEAEDIWEQDFGNNYTDKLDDIDDIKYFQDCMKYLQKEQSNLYSSLIALVPSDQLAIVQEKMNKAIKLLQEVVDSQQNDG